MKKIKITESTFSRIMERMVNETEETDITTALSDTLKTWQTKEYKSHESRWNEYYKDIEAIVNKYTG